MFHLKSSFHSHDIQIFESSPLFFPLSHCFWGWFKKNLKVYDVITCLSKNLITHLFWYFKKEIRCDTETLSIDRVLNMELFMEALCRKSVQKKLALDHLLILLNNPKEPLHARNSFENKIFWKRISKKP